MTEMYSLTVLKARSPKSMYRQACASTEDVREGSFFSLLAAGGGQQSLAILSHPWPSLACNCITLVSASIDT